MCYVIATMKSRGEKTWKFLVFFPCVIWLSAFKEKAICRQSMQMLMPATIVSHSVLFMSRDYMPTIPGTPCFLLMAWKVPWSAFLTLPMMLFIHVKSRILRFWGATTSYDYCMLISELFKNAKAPQALRNKCTTWSKMNISPCFYRIFGKIRYG